MARAQRRSSWCCVRRARGRISDDVIVAFTGHRPDKLGGYLQDNPVKKRILEALTFQLRTLQLAHTNLSALSGMALGVDQWAAQICLDLNIPLTAVIPFEGQEKTWPPHSQAVYRVLRRKASAEVIVTCCGYEGWKMQTRNKWLVDHCDRLLAVWDGSDGGTANCVRYAEKAGKPVERITW